MKNRILAVGLMLMCLFAGSALAQGDALDLRGGSFVSEQEIAAQIEANPGVQCVDLSGALLLVETCQSLRRQYPEIDFIWTIDVFGKEVSSEETSIDFAGVEVNDMDHLIACLDCLPNLREVLMYGNFVPKDYKEKIFARYPETFFGWTIRLEKNRYVIRTDDTAFSTLKNGAPPYFYDDDLWWVKMCPNLVALDLGHNMITDLSFLYDAPQLKILIVACNYIEDLTPISSLHNLEYLEVFKNKITDVSPLAEMDTLIDLNLCVNEISDVSPLFGLTQLERLWLSHNEPITDEHKAEIRAAFPDTEVVFSSQGSTGIIYLDNGKEAPGWRSHPRYDVIHRVFNRGRYEPWEDGN